MNPADIDTLVPVAAEEVQLEEPAAPLVKLDAALSQGPSWLELATGVEGSTRRLLSFYILSFIVATAARQACFSTQCVPPRLFARW